MGSNAREDQRATSKRSDGKLSYNHSVRLPVVGLEERLKCALVDQAPIGTEANRLDCLRARGAEAPLAANKCDSLSL